MPMCLQHGVFFLKTYKITLVGASYGSCGHTNDTTAATIFRTPECAKIADADIVG